MNVLVIGSGGREHALCHSISKSKLLNKLYCIPGNVGMKDLATLVDIDPLNNELIKEFVVKHDIKLVIPGSEVFLENGITDYLSDVTSVFGPTKQAAALESSKEFAKDLMKKYEIPTASYEVFDDYIKAIDYVTEVGAPIVLKYDGLAGGKGVVVALSLEEAYKALDDMLQKKIYGDSKVVIEEYLEGPEYSLMCFVDGENIIKMPIAQDHKRLLDNDLGPNTGGMGIYSTVDIIEDSEVDFAFEHIMKKTIKALKSEGIYYKGFLYGGLMKTESGSKVIEFNARFGDPETEVILPKLESDLLEIITNLDQGIKQDIKWSDDYYVGVVLASKGYPLSYEKGFVIKGLENTNLTYHMGTKEAHNEIVTNGGRVLLVTGVGKTLQEAKDDAYKEVSKISCSNLVYRTDIGDKSLKK